MKKQTNIAASIRQRLLNRSRETGEDYNTILTRFGVERLLFRIGMSSLADRFCLKGAHLFAAWTGQLHRPTRDVDFLAFGSPTPAAAADRFRQLLAETGAFAAAEDGLTFDQNSIAADEIREDQEYGGVRLKILANLAGARIILQVDLGFGDAITPDFEDVVLPSLLDLAPAKLRGYPLPTVIAEKSEALTSLGMANSRMKDFYDLWTIAEVFEPKAADIVQAIQNTFARRRTEIVPEPVALTELFWNDNMVGSRWKAFVSKALVPGASLPVQELLPTLRAFLLPVLGWALAEGALPRPDTYWVRLEKSWLGQPPPILEEAVFRIDAELGRKAKPLEVAQGMGFEIRKGPEGTTVIFEGQEMRLRTWGNRVRRARTAR